MNDFETGLNFGFHADVLAEPQLNETIGVALSADKSKMTLIMAFTGLETIDKTVPSWQSAALYWAINYSNFPADCKAKAQEELKRAQQDYLDYLQVCFENRDLDSDRLPDCYLTYYAVFGALILIVLAAGIAVISQGM